MPKHANFDEIDHLKAYFNSSCQCDHRIHTFIKVTIKDRSLIKTKKVPHVIWTKHYQNHGYMSQFYMILNLITKFYMEQSWYLFLSLSKLIRLLVSNPIVGSLGQFLIKRTRRSKFFKPSQQWQRPIRMLAIKNIILVLIWLPSMPRVTLAK
jgi:hypothetical protein